MMNDMVGRVAKAIEKSYEGAHWDLEIMARAAIEAMREPTQQMKWEALVEGNKAWGDVDEARWRAMIDAALK